MKIISAASAFAQHHYKRDALRLALQQYWGDKRVPPEVLRRLHSGTGVNGRYLALPPLEYYQLQTWSDANRSWFNAAEELGQS